MSNLLGVTVENQKSPTEEEDQKERSNKKVKDGEHDFVRNKKRDSERQMVNTDDQGKKDSRSYLSSLLGSEEKARPEGMGGAEEDNTGVTDLVLTDDDFDEFAGMKVEERKLGRIDCPEFILSEDEKKRIQQPWKHGLIVKLMGRRIGYKALETRLRQMGVQKGVISIIDLSYDYFLVNFTHKEDHYHALMDGPWLIYDHYLVVREWTPDFNPASDSIEKVAVWVRFSGLPIEYYDAKMLYFIGNRIGRTIKVDKNTLMQERGKYARMCVEVDLSKPLLAIFTIKGRQFHVEYEGLHLLCLTCGRFGHTKEGCAESFVVAEEGGNGNGTSGKNTRGETVPDGPWTVVQKQRRPRKAKEKEDSGNGGDVPAGERAENGKAIIQGSRFASLSVDIPELNERSIMGERLEATLMVKSQDTNKKSLNTRLTKSNNQASKNGKKRSGPGSSKIGEVVTEVTHATRVPDKGINGREARAKLAELADTSKMGEFIAQHFPQKDTHDNVDNMMPINPKPNLWHPWMQKKGESILHKQLGPDIIFKSNIPRPPNIEDTSQPPKLLMESESLVQGDQEIFVDAAGGGDSDMEGVESTPRSDH
jgi:hypothetical protein